MVLSRILVRLLFVARAAVGVLALTASIASARAETPVVVELYTSQGCFSCPPADALLGELSAREDVIALSFHVDYWDYIGWKDVFATPEGTNRQRAYAQPLGKRYVYTPQMVIGGRQDAVGSDRAKVARAIEKTEAEGSTLALGVERTEAGIVRLTLPAADYDGEAVVWMAAYDDKHTTDILRGENRGKQLDYFNVVRELREIGRWSGEAASFEIDPAILAAQGRNGCAILVQDAGNGRILAATNLRVASQ